MINIDQPFLTQFLAEIVQIDSCNPDLTPEGQGELKVAEFAAAQLRELGLEVHVHLLAPQRANVVGILRGRGGGRSLMLNAHIDTVGVEGMSEPFSGDIRDGKLYGRGSQDMKGSFAAQVAAAKALIDAGIELDGDLVIAGVADEEFESIGSVDLVKHYVTDAAIVTEPTDMHVCLAHRGFMWYEVETIGRAAHGSRYDEGVDANMMMGRFLGELETLGRAVQDRDPHPLVQLPSLHAAMISGGTAISVYADHCSLKVERRIVPGEDHDAVTADLEALLDKLQNQDARFKGQLHHLFTRTAFEVAADVPIVTALNQVMAENKRGDQPFIGASFWTDASILADAGIETVLLGPIGAGLHSAEEWVDVQSVVELAKILAETAVLYCGVAQ